MPQLSTLTADRMQNKFVDYFRKGLLGILLLLSWAFLDLKAQQEEPPRLQLGASLGLGGVHSYLKPSFDVHYYGAALRFAPGLHFLSAGLSLPVGYLPGQHAKRAYPLLAHVSYHNDWLLGHSRRRADQLLQTRDLQMGMLLLGPHFDLDRMGRYYVEVGVGIAALYRRYYKVEGRTPDPRLQWLPMGELRLGGFLYRRKYYRQYMPWESRKKLFRRE
jgi:hypothetical protein